MIVRWKRDAKEAVGVISHPIDEQIHIREMIVKNLAVNLPEEIEKKILRKANLENGQGVHPAPRQQVALIDRLNRFKKPESAMKRNPNVLNQRFHKKYIVKN